MLVTRSAPLIGLSTVTVSGTVLPFSTIGGNSSFTLPRSIVASPTSARIASSIAAGVAAAGRANGARLKPAAVSSTRRRVGGSGDRWSIKRPSLIAQRRQEGYHILDLFGRQDRLAGPGAADAGEALYPVIGWHDRARVEASRVDEPQPQLTRRPTRTRSGQIRCEGPLKPLLGKGTGVAQETGAEAPVQYDRPAARGIACRSGQRIRNGVADNCVGPQRTLVCDRRGGGRQQQGRGDQRDLRISRKFPP